MAKDTKISTPSGQGGLVTYNETYGKSKLSMSPNFVIFLIVAVVFGMAALKIIF